jgi:muramoyltetrapeptide carboxypeptidase LdcA involved in peptidoglycan recycling
MSSYNYIYKKINGGFLMLNLIKPPKLNRGDTIAAVSLSWGGAGDKDIIWRYEQGKQRLQEIFGLEVVEMPNTLKGSEFVYNHPEKRAEDLMNAFSDTSIKAVIACTGGNDSIRMLPYIDFDIIKNNPKIFSGYSDSTITHLMCLKAGLSSFYGPSILNDFAENKEMSKYTIDWINKIWFNNDIIGSIPVSDNWTGQFLEWDICNKDISREFQSNHGYEIIQGEGISYGRLIGGCIEVLEIAKGTLLFPDLVDFNEAILFFETAEVNTPEWLFEDILRNYGAMGIYNRINGIIFGKPCNEVFYEEYKATIKKILAEYGKPNMPVMYNASFGHNEPKFTVPYGAKAEINCTEKTFSILEPAVCNN